MVRQEICICQHPREYHGIVCAIGSCSCTHFDLQYAVSYNDAGYNNDASAQGWDPPLRPSLSLNEALTDYSQVIFQTSQQLRYLARALSAGILSPAEAREQLALAPLEAKTEAPSIQPVKRKTERRLALDKDI